MSNAKREIVKVLTYETMDPDQLEAFHPQFRPRRRNEYVADHDYNPLKLYDDSVEVSCHREKRR